MRTIPECRKALQEIADRVRNAGSNYIASSIEWVIEDMHRRPMVRKARKTLEWTDEKRAEVIEYARAFPEASYMEIARVCNTNTGRVSEALTGKRQDAKG